MTPVFVPSALSAKMEAVMISAIERDETEEELLNPEVSDRELEFAAGALPFDSDTVSSAYACTENPCCFCRF